MKYFITLAIAIGLVTPVLANTNEKPDASIHQPTEIKWQQGPASLPSGAKLALLEGDPTKDGPFTMRLLLPDGYKISPHTHPKVEHVTVIAGTFNLGMGEKFDQSAGHEMPAGTFGFWPAGMKHFAWAKGETIIQLHGIGPRTINYLNPADDPRQKK
jgi:quercetin dioxygenase-like cupin family protein